MLQSQLGLTPWRDKGTRASNKEHVHHVWGAQWVQPTKASRWLCMHGVHRAITGPGTELSWTWAPDALLLECGMQMCGPWRHNGCSTPKHVDGCACMMAHV
jgi:hypothetical protein